MRRCDNHCLRHLVIVFGHVHADKCDLSAADTGGGFEARKDGSVLMKR
jgi:hypothetical protein